LSSHLYFFKIVGWDYRGNSAAANWRRQKANSYRAFEVAALNGPKYDIEADKLFWFAYNDAKETYELHIR